MAPGADRCECLNLLRALRDPHQHALVVDLLARSPSPRYDENVEGRTRLERRIGNNAKTAGGHDRADTLGKHEDLKGGGLLAASLFIETRDGEDLVRATEVEHFHVGENEDAHALALHLAPRGLTRF
jgi:hypothetical protein